MNDESSASVPALPPLIPPAILEALPLVALLAAYGSLALYVVAGHPFGVLAVVLGLYGALGSGIGWLVLRQWKAAVAVWLARTASVVLFIAALLQSLGNAGDDRVPLAEAWAWVFIAVIVLTPLVSAGFAWYAQGRSPGP
jgi:hypothetical protein